MANTAVDFATAVTHQANQYQPILSAMPPRDVLAIGQECSDLSDRYPMSQIEGVFTIPGWEGEVSGPQVVALMLASLVVYCWSVGVDAWPVYDGWPGLQKGT